MEGLQFQVMSWMSAIDKAMVLFVLLVADCTPRDSNSIDGVGIFQWPQTLDDVEARAPWTMFENHILSRYLGFLCHEYLDSGMNLSM